MSEAVLDLASPAAQTLRRRAIFSCAVGNFFELFDFVLYGFFAVVLGLLAWIYLGSELTVYAAEVNVVLHRRLWPRSLRAPLTPADREVLKLMVLEQRSRADQHISVDFESDQDPPRSGDENGAGAAVADGQSGDGRKPAQTPSGD